MPGWLADHVDRSVLFQEHAPARRDLRFQIQLVRQNEKEKIRTTVPDQALELGPAIEAILEGGGLSQNAPITAVTDRIEIVRIIFGEKRIASPEGRVVDAKMLLENLAPAPERAKAFACRRGLAIIAAQIRQRLFAFEDRGHGLLADARSIGRHIGPIAALR